MSIVERLAALSAAREKGGEYDVLQLLLKLIESTPFFECNLSHLRAWIIEARDLGHRSVITPEQEALELLRHGQLFLADGGNRQAFDVASEVIRRGSDSTMYFTVHGQLLQARALVRMGQRPAANAILAGVGNTELGDDRRIAGEWCLINGESQLYAGGYETAYPPLVRAIDLLSDVSQADRQRYDALVSLGLLDHRLGELETASYRYGAALALAHEHNSLPEQVECHLLLAALYFGMGRDQESGQQISKALELSHEAVPPGRERTFPTERLRNLVGATSVEQLIDRATTQAAACGEQHDLMGYVQLTALVAALMSADSRREDAVSLLTDVAQNLEDDEQCVEALVLRKYAHKS